MRKVTAIMAAAVAVLLLASACGDGEESPSITVEDLTGIWKLQPSPTYLQFNEDGTYRIAVGIANLEDDPIDLGQFRLEGTLVTFTSSDESPDCPGQSGSYQVELTGEGLLQFALEEDPCEGRADPIGGLPSAPWRQTSP